MAEAIEKLQKHKEIDILPQVKEKLLKISASTIDRLLKPEKDRRRLGKGRKGTKLKEQQFSNIKKEAKCNNKAEHNISPLL